MWFSEQIVNLIFTFCRNNVREDQNARAQNILIFDVVSLLLEKQIHIFEFHLQRWCLNTKVSKEFSAQMTKINKQIVISDDKIQEDVEFIELQSECLDTINRQFCDF